MKNREDDNKTTGTMERGIVEFRPSGPVSPPCIKQWLRSGSIGEKNAAIGLLSDMRRTEVYPDWIDNDTIESLIAIVRRRDISAFKNKGKDAMAVLRWTGSCGGRTCDISRTLREIATTEEDKSLRRDVIAHLFIICRDCVTFGHPESEAITRALTDIAVEDDDVRIRIDVMMYLIKLVGLRGNVHAMNVISEKAERLRRDGHKAHPIDVIAKFFEGSKKDVEECIYWLICRINSDDDAQKMIAIALVTGFLTMIADDLPYPGGLRIKRE